MPMCNEWSRTVLPKVFGAVFLVCGVSEASQYTSALNSASKALIIQSGVRDKVNSIKRNYTKQARELLKQANIEKEVSTIGATVQIIREKSISIQYDGVDYQLLPNEIRVRFHF